MSIYELDVDEARVRALRPSVREISPIGEEHLEAIVAAVQALCDDVRITADDVTRVCCTAAVLMTDACEQALDIIQAELDEDEC